MPKPGASPALHHEFLGVPRLPWLSQALGGGLVRGGVYLISGEPGVGKSTLGLQVLGEMAQRGHKVLYVTTEQSLADFEAALRRLFGSKSGTLPPGITQSFHLEDRLKDVDDLPRFLTRQVLPLGQEYHGTKVLVFDSIQGRGLSSSSTQKYQALYEFLEMAKAQGLVTILLGHVTKGGQIAGPKNLEHNVDCVLYLRRAYRLRPLFVPKNRFGPALLDPIALVMDKVGRLSRSSRMVARSASVYGYAGRGREFAEVQASVSLAKYGSSPGLNAPSLPGPKMRQRLKVLSELEDVDLSDLSYEVNAYIPGRRGYSEELDLPLAVSLLSSYLQHDVPATSLFVGELDLLRRVRPPKREYMEGLSRSTELF
jgi:DNA repair protein RadA/Sms